MRPTICSPTGMPSESKPQGMLAAGWPIVLMGWVNGRKLQPFLFALRLPPTSSGYCPTGKAVVAIAGESSRSYSSKTSLNCCTMRSRSPRALA